MKKLFKLKIVATALVAVHLLFAAPARAQVTPTTVITLTNLPPLILGNATGNSTSNLFVPNNGSQPTANIISVRQGQGMAAAATVIGNLSSVTTLGFSINWSVSVDGIHWQTANYLQLTNLPSGVVTNTFVTNYASTSLNNALYIAPASIEWCGLAGTNMTISNAVVSFGNIVPGSY